MKTISVLILSIVFYVHVKAQSNYYVSPTGNNNNNGLQNTPWKTIQFGLNQLSNGDTLNVSTGTYNEKIVMPVSGITLRNLTGQTPVITAGGIIIQQSIIKIFNVSNILVSGFELMNNVMNDAQGILIDGNCQHITIQNCLLHDIHFSSNPNAAVNANTNAQGIIVYGSNASSAITDLKIMNNTLYDCRLGYSEGIAVNGNVSGFEISGNRVYNLTNIGIDAIGHEGTCTNAAKNQARNGLIKNNIVYDCISAYATSGGLYVDGGKNIIIENNISFHNGYGIEIGCEKIGKTTDSIAVRSNIFFDNEISAIAFGGYDYPGGSGKVTHSTLRNNTCYADDFSNSGNGELYLSYSENSIIENNIFYTSSQNILTNAELTQPGLQFDRNLIFCPGGSGSLISQLNGTNFNTYTGFVSGSGTNVNSLFADPLFIAGNITTPDFHILPASPAINSGNPFFTINPSEVDMDNENRANGIIDCGADEYYVGTYIPTAGNNENRIQFFPNPARDYVNLRFSKTEKIITFSIYNLQGQLISKADWPLEGGFDIGLLEDGIYLVEVVNESEIFVGKIIKVK